MVQVVYVALILLLLAADLSLPRLAFSGTVAVAIFTLLSFFAYATVWLQAVAAGRRAV
jgi:hypothetical protein